MTDAWWFYEALSCLAYVALLERCWNSSSSGGQGSHRGSFEQTDTDPASSAATGAQILVATNADGSEAGNAAVHYGKVKSEQTSFFASKETWKQIEIASQCPLEQLKTDASFDSLLGLGPIYGNLRAGARSSTVDWQLPLRETFFTGILLPEVQEARSFAKILYCRARIQIARGDFEGAIETMQTGMALGKHVAQGETLINGLVGMVCINMMLSAAQEFIAQPGAPNLYWALADLPTPLNDLRPGLEGERAALYLTEEAWLHPEKLQGDEHFWRRELQRLWTYLKSAHDRPVSDDMLTMYVLRGYASGKKRLVERGFDSQEVELMPAAKVIMLDALHQYNCDRDLAIAKIRQAFFDPTRLPQLQSVRASNPAESLPLWEMMGVGTLHSVAYSVLTIERHRAALQVVEAIRLHVVESGKLPARLEDITSVHVPVDPSTGRAFQYELAGDTATLSSNKLTLPLKLELRLAK